MELTDLIWLIPLITLLMIVTAAIVNISQWGYGDEAKEVCPMLGYNKTTDWGFGEQNIKIECDGKILHNYDCHITDDSQSNKFGGKMGSRGQKLVCYGWHPNERTVIAYGSRLWFWWL